MQKHRIKNTRQTDKLSGFDSNGHSFLTFIPGRTLSSHECINVTRFSTTEFILFRSSSHLLISQLRLLYPVLNYGRNEVVRIAVGFYLLHESKLLAMNRTEESEGNCGSTVSFHTQSGR